MSFATKKEDSEAAATLAQADAQQATTKQQQSSSTKTVVVNSKNTSPASGVETKPEKQARPFKFNRFQEKAKYDGRTKYEKPRQPYRYDYRYKHVDTSLPVTEWAYQWFRNTQKDALAYFYDLTINRNNNAVMFKTTGFIKRQFGRVFSFLGWFGSTSWVVWVAIKHGVQHMVHGLKNLFKDGKWVVKQKVKSQQNVYSHSTFSQQQKIKQVKKDFIKFVPFSLFLLIPGGELFLPAWVMIFPNSIPSQFVGEEERIKKFHQMKERQEDAAEKLLYILPNYMAKLQQSNIPDEPKEKIKLLKNLLKQDGFLPTDLLEYRQLFSRYGHFRMFRTKSLMHMAHFMSIEPVTGLNTLNNVLRLFKVQIPVDARFIEIMTQRLVARELNMLFRQLRQQDLVLDQEELDNFTEEQLTKVCFARGININQSHSKQLKDLKLWLSISNKRNVPNSLLLVIRLHDFNNDQFEIDNDENQEEILRRSKSDAYYIESVKAFEKAFGMDRLEKLISETQNKRNLLLQDSKKNRFIFQSEDLNSQAEALDEFTTRHRTITGRINETYKIGNQMMSYLENQIILDHHFRGEQDIFEQEFPHLKSKAEKLLGYETYFNFAPLTGSPLQENMFPELYAKLTQIQNKILSDLDVNLAKHNVKIDQFEEDITAKTTPMSKEDDVEDEDINDGEATILSSDQAPILSTQEKGQASSSQAETEGELLEDSAAEAVDKKKMSQGGR